MLETSIELCPRIDSGVFSYDISGCNWSIGEMMENSPGAVPSPNQKLDDIIDVNVDMRAHATRIEAHPVRTFTSKSFEPELADGVLFIREDVVLIGKEFCAAESAFELGYACPPSAFQEKVCSELAWSDAEFEGATREIRIIFSLAEDDTDLAQFGFGASLPEE